tara:strand:- start:4018 stop:4812 length:795 start_codon:yes stop_codon:yes gene_type:complete
MVTTSDKIDYSQEAVAEALAEFRRIYSERPVIDNEGGMKSPHLFNTWFSLKELQPELVIESGVWKGLGTWVIEQAVPSANIISIEINYSHLQYKSKKVHYLSDDITSYDWGKLLEINFPDIKKDKIVVFLDDHQNFIERLEFIHSLGIKHVLYEDNYPSSQGDTFSPKKILSQQDYVMDHAGQRSTHTFSPIDYERFSKCVKTYQELPPIFKTERTRWGDSWTAPKYPTKEPLLPEHENKNFPTFFEEADSYTWICYMELRENV